MVATSAPEPSSPSGSMPKAVQIASHSRQYRGAFRLQHHAQPGGCRHFPQRGNDAAFGDVVEAVDVHGFT